MSEGTVIFFNTKSKFGFIKEDQSGVDYYFHIKNPIESFVTGSKVRFEIRKAKKGFEAFNVKLKEASAS